MKINRWISHQYDVDAMRMFSEMEKCTKEHYSRKGITREEYLDRIKDSLKICCQNLGIDFPQHFQHRLPLVIASDSPAYESFLGYTLICFDPYRMNRFLDYQKERYNGPGDFINLVEYNAYTIARKNSPFENRERLERIMNWVESNRRSNAVTVKKVTSSTTLFTWLDDPAALKDFSQRLYHRGYTDKSSSFYNAITKGIPCSWRKGTESLVYLFYLLTQTDSQILKPKGNRGYLNAIVKLFDFGQKSPDKINLRDLSYRIRKNDKKYGKLRSSIEDLAKPLYPSSD